jgi:hypothetical protein
MSKLIRGRRQDGELGEQLDRLEEEMRGAVGPGGLQRHGDAAIGGALETVLRDGWAQDVAGEPLQDRAIVGGDDLIGVEIEAVEVRVARPARDDPRSVGIAPDLENARAGAWAEGDTALHGGGAETGERRRFLGEGIDGGGRRIVSAEVEAAAGEEPEHAGADGGKEAGDLGVGGRGSRMELQAAIGTSGEHAVEGERVVVHVEIDGRAEALNRGDGAARSRPPLTLRCSVNVCARDVLRCQRLPSLPARLPPRVSSLHFFPAPLARGSSFA